MSLIYLCLLIFLMMEIFSPKFFTVLKEGYSFKLFQKDAIAGVIVGIVALPLAIAFAIASGVSPDKGLITAIVAGFIISLLGGSRVQIGGPTGAFVVIVFGIIEQYGFQGLLISTFLAGMILVAFGLLNLGSLLKFIPYPLIVGFTSGIAVIIFSTQIKDAFGLELGKLPSDFISKWGIYFSNFNKINFIALAITVSTILISLYSSKIIKKIPGSFISIILMTVIVAWFDIPVTTIKTMFGEIPNRITFDGFQNFDFSNFSHFIQPAFTIAMLGAIESLLSAVVADGMISSRHRSNTELIAQGIANMGSAIVGGIPATGAIARTATNIKNGGRTPVAGIVHAIVLLLIMLVFGKYAALIPMSCLAGILIVVAFNMSEYKSFISICKSSKYDVVVLLTTFFLTVLVDLTVAIEIGMVLTAFLFMQRMSALNSVVPLDESVDSNENYLTLPKGLSVYEINGPFFFGAAQKYRDTLSDVHINTKVLILRMRYVPFIDATGMRNFITLLKDLSSKHVKIYLSGVRPEIRVELDKSNVAKYIGENHIFDNYVDAYNVASAESVLVKKMKHKD